MLRRNNEHFGKMQNDYKVIVEHHRASEENILILPHWHDQLEIIYLICGTLNFHINGETRFLTAGNLAVINSAQVHFGNTSDKKTEFIDLVIDYDFMRSRTADRCEIQFMLPMFTKHLLIKTFIDTEPGAAVLMENIFKEYENKKPGWELFVKAYVLSLTGVLIRDYTDYENKPQNVKALQEIVEIVNYIDEHYKEPDLIKILPQIAGFDKSYFIRKFKYALGTTPVLYLNFIRLQKARDMLLLSTLSVSEVAFEVGFENPNYFTRKYKENFGITPHFERKNANNQK
ncbi:MAG: hypothetical protein K0S55_580 [Clostridia bacterium]|nr:hypothetical protein [Clostridia bacterium]